MSTAAIRTRRWTRREYDRMGEPGLFGPEDRIKLLDGEILETIPQGSRHATACSLVTDSLRQAFGAGRYVRARLPVALDDISEPEPDIAVVRGSPRDYRDAHPTHALLVVEVSDASLSYDRDPKLRAYARNGVPEYWLLNLVDSQLEVYRDPSAAGYTSRFVLTAGDRVRPLHAPDAAIVIADLLP